MLLIHEGQCCVFYQDDTLHVAFTLTHKYDVHSRLALMNVLSPLLTEGLQVL
jgi:hypothetical protein